MHYNQLPVFKAACDLQFEIFISTQHVKREYRYTLCEELKKEVMALLLAVYRANSQEIKRDEISKAREHIEVAKLLVRLLHDLKQLSLKQVV